MDSLLRGLSKTSCVVLFFVLLGVSQAVWAQDLPVIFSATGDVPYGSSEISVFQQQMLNHNKYSPSAFLVHVGDILSGGSACTESVYSQVSGIMKTLTVPAYIAAGDNETVDCSSPAQGMNYFLKYFKNFENNFCGAPYTERQSVRPENWAFTMNNVLFVGINLAYGGTTAQQQAADWVRQQLEAKASTVRAAAVFAHYTPGNFSAFSTPFRQAAAAFVKPILFLHGHGHAWSTSYPFPEKNVLRVQVDNGGAEDPVEVTVTLNNSSPANAFALKRNPWSSKNIVNMPPCVIAGADQTIDITSTATLQGSAKDDGDPSGTLIKTWSVATGPGTVTFGNPNSLTTTASFSVPGTYVLRLTADDTQLQSSDEVTINVQSVNPTLAINDVTLNEGHFGTTDAVFTVSLTGGNGSTVTVDYQVVDGTATSGEDYVANPSSGTLTFPNGTTAQTITVSINGDQIDEQQDETFFVNLSNPTNADIIDGQGQGNIVNDDVPMPPNAPSNLVANATGNSTVTLSWMDNSDNESGFKIERKTGAGSFTEIANVDAGVNSFGDSGLNSGTNYTYRLCAFNAEGHSGYSNETRATTTGGQVANPSVNLALNKTATALSSDGSYPPSRAVDGSTSTYWRSGSISSSNPISWLRVDLGSMQTVGRAIVRWKDDYIATSFQFQVSTNNVDWTTVHSMSGALGNQEFAFAQTAARYARLYLTATTKSSYRILEFEIYSGPLPPPPNTPSNLSVAWDGTTTMHLSWKDNSSNEAGFKIERKIGNGSYSEIASLGADATSYDDVGVSANTTCTYQVRAFNADGHSGYSNEASATTPGADDPNLNRALNKLSSASSSDASYPPSLAVDGSTSTYWRSGSIGSSNPIAWLRVDLGVAQLIARAMVRWKSDYIAKSFQLQVSNNDVDWTTVTTMAGVIGNQEIIFAQTSARYVRLYMTANAKSTYRISEFEVYYGPFVPPPNAPSDLAVTATKSWTITITWKDNAADETGFKIERAISGGAFSEIATTGANVTSFDDTGVTGNTTYVYRVRATSNAGDSNYDEASTTTPAGGSNPSINLALNKPATALSSDGSYPPSWGVDGSTSTYWRSGGISSSNPVSWLRVDLGTNQIVGRAIVRWKDDYIAASYQLQVSENDVDWTTVHSAAGAVGNQEFTFALASARYVRLYMTANTKSSYRIYELEVYSGPVSAATSKRHDETAAETAVPTEFSLKQNYPNPFGRPPFNPSTEIRFALPQASHVTIKLYAINGAEVATLVDGYYRAGRHMIIFHANTLANGTYLYVMQAGDFRKTRRLMLLK